MRNEIFGNELMLLSITLGQQRQKNVIVKKMGEKLLLLTHFLIPTKEDLQSQYENTVSNLMSASFSGSG